MSVNRPGLCTLKRDYFFLDQVSHSELCRILSNHFRQGGYANEDRQIWSNPEQSKLLIIDFDKGQRITAISTVGLTSPEIEIIQQDVRRKLIDDQEDSIRQMVCLSLGRIDGGFRYKQEFCIVPAPADIPKMDHIFGEHPYLLQLRYKRSKDQLTSDLRVKKRAFEVIPILNGITRTHFLLPTKYTTFSWGISLNGQHDPAPQRFREDYVIKRLEIDLSEFDNQGLLIELIPRGPYYDIRNNVNWPVVLPENFELLLDTAFSLPQDEYQKLYRACLWFTKGQQIWRISESASFLCVVSALESLVARAEKCTECHQTITEGLSICPSCDQPQYRVTKAFKEFIQQYAPRAASKDQFMKLVYKVRSDLVHGLDDLLQSEVSPWAIFEKPQQAYQERLQRDLFDCASEAIVNWLWIRSLPSEATESSP